MKYTFIGDIHGKVDCVKEALTRENPIFVGEFEAIPGLTQVFGHTRGNGIRQEGENFCIDCLDGKMEFLEIEI